MRLAYIFWDFLAWCENLKQSTLFVEAAVSIGCRSTATKCWHKPGHHVQLLQFQSQQVKHKTFRFSRFSKICICAICHYVYSKVDEEQKTFLEMVKPALNEMRGSKKLTQILKNTKGWTECSRFSHI